MYLLRVVFVFFRHMVVSMLLLLLSAERRWTNENVEEEIYIQQYQWYEHNNNTMS
jgi:hypothetical protein